MDFLDPKRKKAHRQRLLVGYVLTAVAIAMTTLILMFSAYGFDIDRKTGSVIQNGTVFIDSLPVSADIYLDNVIQHSRTATRLVIPGGQYSLKLTSNGYRDWLRTFSIDGGKIERIIYPLLIPKIIKPIDTQAYSTKPALVTQSNDRRWLLVLQPGQTSNFDLYDLDNGVKTSPSLVSLPNLVLTNPAATSSWTVVEWSDDDKHVLLDRSFENKHEFIVIDIENAANSQNINSLLGISPSRVNFRNKKSDQFYSYDSNGGILRSADIKNRTLSGPLLTGVLNFVSSGNDIILYATKEGADSGKVDYRIRENDKTSYLLKSVPDGSVYLLAIGEYDNTTYYVVGTNTDDAVSVYKDPLPALKGQTTSPLLVNTVIRLDDPQFVSFAPKGQFISVQKGNQLKSYDIFAERQYRLDLEQSVDPARQLRWLDSHHLLMADQQSGYIVDFDGFNNQTLLPTYDLATGPYFSPNFKSIFSVSPSVADPSKPALVAASMVSE